MLPTWRESNLQPPDQQSDAHATEHRGQQDITCFLFVVSLVLHSHVTGWMSGLLNKIRAGLRASDNILSLSVAFCFMDCSKAVPLLQFFLFVTSYLLLHIAHRGPSERGLH